MSSAGFVLTNTVGAAAAVVADRAPNAAFTSFQLSSAGSFAKLAGNGVCSGFQGPWTSEAVIQFLSTRRKYVLGEPYSNRSQLVFTANRKSLSEIGLQIGSPSMFTRTADRSLKKIGGGSALMPSRFFGVT